MNERHSFADSIRLYAFRSLTRDGRNEPRKRFCAAWQISLAWCWRMR
jgi:hypothetical protein